MTSCTYSFYIDGEYAFTVYCDPADVTEHLRKVLRDEQYTNAKHIKIVKDEE